MIGVKTSTTEQAVEEISFREAILPPSVRELRQEAGTESQTTEAVSLLESLRSGVSAGRAGGCLGSGPAQRRRSRRRWSEHPTDCRQAGKRGGVSGGHSTELAGTDLSRPSGAASLYPQAQWKTEAVGNSDGARPGGAGSGVADTGANL